MVESRKTEVATIQLQLVSTCDTSGSSRSRSRPDHNIKLVPKSISIVPIGDFLGQRDSPIASTRGRPSPPTQPFIGKTVVTPGPIEGVIFAPGAPPNTVLEMQDFSGSSFCNSHLSLLMAECEGPKKQ